MPRGVEMRVGEGEEDQRRVAGFQAEMHELLQRIGDGPLRDDSRRDVPDREDEAGRAPDHEGGEDDGLEKIPADHLGLAIG